MTAVRIPIQEYASNYELSTKLSQAVSECYISQSTNPEAVIARRFMRLSFNSVIDSVKYGKGYIKIDNRFREATTIELVINGKGCGESILSEGECDKEEISQSLRGKMVNSQSEIDSSISIMQINPSVQFSLSYSCLMASVNESGSHIYQSIASINSNEGGDSSSDHSQISLPNPIMWMLSTDNSELKVGLTDTSDRTLAEKISNLYNILNEIRSSNTDLLFESNSGILTTKTSKTMEELIEIIDSAVKPSENENSIKLELSSVGITLSNSSSEISSIAALQERDNNLNVKFVQDGFNKENGELQLASKQLYGSINCPGKTVIGCSCDSELDMNVLLKSHSCQASVFDPIKFGTISSLISATRHWRNSPGNPPICVTSNPHIAAGLSATFFSASPSPESWNAFLSIASDVVQNGCLIPSPAVSSNVPLPATPRSTPSPPEIPSRKQSRAAKKK